MVTDCRLVVHIRGRLAEVLGGEQSGEAPGEEPPGGVPSGEHGGEMSMLSSRSSLLSSPSRSEKSSSLPYMKGSSGSSTSKSSSLSGESMA